MTPTVRPHRLAFAVLTALASTAALADEGMWVPQQLPEIAKPLAAAGLELDPAQLADLTGQPMGAVVSLGGCTASFVSPTGLVVTNHHCAYGSIQLNSTPERNLLETGFNAATTADELSGGPNARIYVTERITDVSDRIAAVQRADLDGAARDRAIDAESKRLVAECEQDAGYRCSVAKFFGGVQYRLFKQLEIKDVRLVYAPAGAIGNYGGEVDNWMWPRHTGDFSFIRAYVGKDGKPAAYSPDNVPYRPKHWLRIAPEGLAAGDFAMIAGYPGSTARYALAGEFENTAAKVYPAYVGHYRDLVALIEAGGKADKDVEIKYASTIRGYLNTMKNWQGQVDGFAAMGATARKRAEEAAVLAWLRGRGASGQPALEAHAQLQALQARREATQERDRVLGALGGLFGNARNLYRLAIERAKPDAERERGYQQRDLATFEGNLRQFEKRFAPGMDRQILEYWLGKYVALPQAQRLPELDAWLGGLDAAHIDRALDAAYAATKLGSTDERLRLMTAGRAEFEASSDPFVQLAVKLMPALLAIEEQGRQLAGEDARWRPAYLQGVIDYNRAHGTAVYPDANSTLRITYGHVTGYAPRDGVAYVPFTTLEGLAAKATGTAPFNAPAKELALIRAKDYGGRAVPALGSVPVNFMTDTDITGGNSGSPTLNAKGELVGLAFDGNLESVAGNWLFDPALKRTIHVDVRYLLWLMENVEPAPRLLEEMGVARPKG
jgi:V8-like Glu-specific endopeptidase